MQQLQSSADDKLSLQGQSTDHTQARHERHQLVSQSIVCRASYVRYRYVLINLRSVVITWGDTQV